MYMLGYAIVANFTDPCGSIACYLFVLLLRMFHGFLVFYFPCYKFLALKWVEGQEDATDI